MNHKNKKNPEKGKENKKREREKEWVWWVGDVGQLQRSLLSFHATASRSSAAGRKCNYIRSRVSFGWLRK